MRLFPRLRALTLHLSLGLLGTLAACNASAPEEHTDDETRSQEDLDAIYKRLHFGELRAAETVRLASLPAEIIIPDDATYRLVLGAQARIQHWAVRIGDSVEIGQKIADISNYEQSDLHGQISAAQTAVDQRKQQLESKERAHSAGATTSEDLQNARANLQEARAQLRALQRAQRARNTDQDASQWLSPVQGVVASIDCAPGAVVDATTACLTVLNTDERALRTHLPERLLSAVDQDSLIHYYPWGSNTPQRTWTLVRRAPTLDPLSRTQAVDFHSEDLHNSLPGQSGRIEIFAPADAHYFDVPRYAVTQLDDQDILFVELPDHDLPEAIPITRIAQQHDRVIISSEDLSAGTRYVERGAFLLKSLAVAELGGGHEH